MIFVVQLVCNVGLFVDDTMFLEVNTNTTLEVMSESWSETWHSFENDLSLGKA